MKFSELLYRLNQLWLFAVYDIMLQNLLVMLVPASNQLCKQVRLLTYLN